MISPVIAMLLLSCHPAEVHPLTKLPKLHAGEEQESRDYDHCPLPSDALVLEDDAVDDGNVEGRENSDEADEDGPEKEFIAADVVVPEREQSQNEPWRSKRGNRLTTA